jgi:hypothetical protein
VRLEQEQRMYRTPAGIRTGAESAGILEQEHRSYGTSAKIRTGEENAKKTR